jgi:hypothetical protein
VTAGAAGRQWLRWPSRPLLAAAGVLVVALVAAGVAVVAGRDGDGGRLAAVGDCGHGEPCRPTDGEDGPTGATAVALVTAPRDVVEALEVERDMASVDLLGLSDVLAMPVVDSAEARRNTDDAIAAFRESVAEAPGAEAYGPALDRLAALDALRAELDDIPGPRDLQNIDNAEMITSRYEELVATWLDAQEAYVGTIDDPELRDGAGVYLLAFRERELTAQLVRRVLVTAVSPGPSAVVEVGRLQGLAAQGRDDLVEQSTGTPYEEAVGPVAVRLDDLLGRTAAAATGPVDIVAVLEASDWPRPEDWPVLLDRVEEILAGEG